MSITDRISTAPPPGGHVRSSAPGGGAYSAAGGEDGRLPPMILGFLLAILLPSTMVFALGETLLSPVRIWMVLITLPALGIMMSSVRLRLYDYLFIGYIGWLALCALINYGASGTTFIGLMLINNLGVYAMVQASVRRAGDIPKIVWFYFGMVVLLGILAVPEAVLKVRYLASLGEMLSGFERDADKVQNDERLGMLRASSVFSHQILYGFFSAPILAYVWYLSRSGAGQIFSAVAVAAATFFALSSGPLLGVLIQLLLIVTERVTRPIPNRFRLFAAAAVLAYIGLDLVSGRGPLRLVLSYMTLNPATAYYRLLIFDNAIDDFWRGPIFGIRPETWTRLWWMPPSMDNYWLLQALRGGFPALILGLGSVVAVLVALFRKPDTALPPLHIRLRRAAAYAMVGIVLCATTVHLFGKAEPLFAFFLGLAAATARMVEDAPDPVSGGGEHQAQDPPPRRRTYL